eukprot:scaffold6597_cov77-Phaeocystis_antarctica.AAC.1
MYRAPPGAYARPVEVLEQSFIRSNDSLGRPPLYSPSLACRVVHIKPRPLFFQRSGHLQPSMGKKIENNVVSQSTGRKHPPVSGGKRPLRTLGVPPGRSRGIGGCARAPCVRGGKPVLLPNWWSPPGPESESVPGPAPGKSGYLSLRKFLASAADALQDSRCGAARVCHGEALGSRPVPGTPSGKRSAGTHRAVRVVCMLSERTARAAQLAPSAVTASAVGGSATRSVVAESLRRRAARRGARAIARRGGAARRRRDSATTLLVADPPIALVVTAEGASCAARA